LDRRGLGGIRHGAFYFILFCSVLSFFARLWVERSGEGKKSPKTFNISILSGSGEAAACRARGLLKKEKEEKNK
jgi:hypothetical protein